MITLDAAFKSGCNKSKVQDLGYIIKIVANNSSIFYFSTTEILGITAATPIYPCVKNCSDIISSINPHDSSYSVSNFSFQLAEGFVYTTGGVRYNTVDILNPQTGYAFRNRDVSVYLYHSDTGYASLNIFPLIFSGVTKDFSFDDINKVWNFECISKWETQHKQLPATTVDKKTYTKAPYESFGMPIPILYGRWTQVSTYPNADFYHNNYQMAPTVCVDATSGKFIVAGHAISAFTIGANVGVGYYFDGLKTYGIAVKDSTGADCTTSITDPAYILLPATADQWNLYADSVYLIPEIKGRKSGISSADMANLIDRDKNTGVALTTEYQARFSSLQSSSEFRKVTGSGTPTINVYANVTAITGSNPSNLRIYSPAIATTVDSAATFTTTGQKTYAIEFLGTSYRVGNDGSATGYGASATTQFTWEELIRYDYGIKIGTSETVTLSVLGLQVKTVLLEGMESLFSPPSSGDLGRRQRDFGRGGTRFENFTKDSLPTRNYEWDFTGTKRQQAAGCKLFAYGLYGRKFIAWIDNGRAGVGTRTNASNSGDDIRRDIFIAESIIRDELGANTEDVNDVSFDTYETPAFEFQVSVNEFINSRDLIRDLSFFSKAIIFYSSDGLWTCFRYKDTPNSATLDLYETQIRINKVYLTPTDWLCNDVEVNYHYDFATGNFLFKASASDSTSQGTTVDGENRTSSVKLSCPFLRNIDTTDLVASDFANYFVANWKDPHFLVDFDLLDISLCGLQEGDTVTFNEFGNSRNDDGTLIPYNPLNLGQGSATDSWSSFTAPRTKYWLIIRCSRSLENGKVSYTAMQLHDLT